MHLAWGNGQPRISFFFSFYGGIFNSISDHCLLYTVRSWRIIEIIPKFSKANCSETIISLTRPFTKTSGLFLSLNVEVKRIKTNIQEHNILKHLSRFSSRDSLLHYFKLTRSRYSQRLRSNRSDFFYVFTVPYPKHTPNSDNCSVALHILFFFSAQLV